MSDAGMTDLTRKYDVLVVGGGNAALCAAISARRAGASVLVLEAAPKFYRGGNTRHTRNMRCAHDAATEILTGPYTEEEFFDDLLRVTGGQTDEPLARLMIHESKEMLGWIVEQGVRFQPSLGGTLSLGRTNSFFLGGGRAMLNALYRTAEALGVEVATTPRWSTSTSRRHVPVGDREAGDGTATVRAGALRRGRRRVRGQHRMAEAILGRRRRQLPDPRHAVQPRHDAARCCSTTGVQEIGDPTQCHAVAIDARAPKFDGGIITRLDCVVFGIVVNKHAERFYDEGEDIWPKRYAIWGRLVAASPTRSPTSSSTHSSRNRFMPSLFPPIEAATSASLPASSASIAARWRRRSRDFNAAVRPGTFDHTILDDCRTEGLTPPKTHWARRHRDGAVLCLSGAARHHLHLSRHPREPGGAHADEGRPALGQHVRGRRDHGRQRARPRLCRRASA